MQGPGVIGPPTGIPLGGGISKDAWTQALAAALAAGLARKYYLAARIRWTIDATCAMETEHYLWNDIAGTAHREGWTLAHGQETMRALGGLAIAEMLYPAKFGHDPQRLKWFGNRIKLPIERIEPAWNRTWRGRYEQAAWQTLERWTDVAASHVSFKQRGDDEEEN